MTVFSILAVTAFGIATALAIDEPFVYDPVIGETVPAELVDGLRDAIGDPDSPGGDGGPLVPETPVETPDPYPPSIAPVNGDGDTPPPFSPQTLRPTNAYSQGSATSARIVYAGAEGNGTTGVLIDMTLAYDDGTSDETQVSSPDTGALTITGFTSTTLTLSSDSGRTGTYELASRALTMQPGPCNPPRACLPAGPD